MSLNGDILVMRNGRSTSQVSVYNYPEHLNPFYEDDQHKRLRFWQINKKNDNGSRRNSFSIGGLKDMWSFKSFRMKKKSSTLGINKTSESPPPLRRDFEFSSPMTGDFLTYDRRSRYSTESNFPRNAPYRSSLQNMYDSPNSSGSGFDRNNQYRSTIQFAPASVGHSPHPHARRYLYAESPQSQRASETGRGNITRGSSQTSLISTNPFETDNEENEDVSRGNGPSSKKPAKKPKRRAPAPPPLVNGATSSDKEKTSLPEQRLHIEEESEIAHLTAAIESFVETARNSSPERESKTSSNEASTCIKSNGALQNSPPSKTMEATSNSTPTPENYKKQRLEEIVPTSKEVGHVECIHVHVESPRATPEQQERSRVTSFRSEHNKDSEKCLSKTAFTLTDSKSATQHSNNGTKDSIGALSKRKEVTLPNTIDSSQTSREMTQGSQHSNDVGYTLADVTRGDSTTFIRSTLKQKNMNEPTKDDSESSKTEYDILIKPPIAAKPTVEPKTKSKIPSPRKDEIKTDTIFVTDSEKIDHDIKPEAPTPNPRHQRPSLKIIESEEDLLQPTPGSSLGTIGGSRFTSAQSSSQRGDAPETIFTPEAENLYRQRPSSHLVWKTSTLAPLEPRVPREKRKSVKDIIESINRSQRLLHAAAHKNDEEMIAHLSSRSDTNDEVIVSSPLMSVAHNNLNQNFKNLGNDDQPTPDKPASKSNDNAIVENFNDNSDSSKLDNAEIFQKCKINKEIHDYSYREASPTISNMDWNPVPKPKRTKNLSDF